jgi:TatD DNase family protein
LTVNLTDATFNGIYRGKTKHAGNIESTVLERPPENLVKDDLEAVIGRAHDAGVGSMIITGISLNESRKALELARKYSGQKLLRSEAVIHHYT